MSLFSITAIIALSFSLLAKYFVDTFLTSRLPLLTSFVALNPTHNSGVAFGVQFPPVIQTILILCALGFVCVLAWRTKPTTFSSIGYGLIVGGALGNVLDRVRDGVVTDFIQVGSFPVFNVADSCITIGVIFLLAEVFGIVRSH